MTNRHDTQYALPIATSSLTKGRAVKVSAAVGDGVLRVANGDPATDDIIGVVKQTTGSSVMDCIVYYGRVQVWVGSTTVAANDTMTDGSGGAFGKTGTKKFGTYLSAKDGNNLAWAWLGVLPGSPGANGQTGSIWRSGTGAPSGSLGIVGDWYLNDANGDVYEKTGTSTYTLRDNLTGPTGATGSAGAAGNGFDSVEMVVLPSTLTLTTGDGKMYFGVPSALNGWKLNHVAAFVQTASSSGLPTIQIANVVGGYDMLTTKLTIDVSEKTSYTAATAAVIDTASSHDVVSTGDQLRIDVDVAGTGTKGLIVFMKFVAP